DRSGKAIMSHSASVLRAVIHGAVVVPSEAEIDALAQVAFELRENPGHPLGVVPDVLAGSRTAVDSFPTVEAAAVEPMAGCCGQGIDRNKCPIQEPIRQ